MHICTIYASVWICISKFNMCVGARRGQKQASNTLEMELLTALSCPIYVLGTKLRSSRGMVHILNH